MTSVTMVQGESTDAGAGSVTRECAHCGSGLTSAGRFCCVGCRVVYGLLQERGLGRYYDLRNGAVSPAPAPTPTRDLKWLEALEAEVSGAAAGRAAVRVEMDVQGLQCAACVWVLDELFARHPGALRVEVNPALGRVEMLVGRDFPLRDYVSEIESLGYLLGPARKAEAPRSHGLVGRIGLCAAIALNAMLFSLPIYLGLHTGLVYTAFRWLALGLATASVAVGGSVFFRAAWESLRHRVLHLDVPIALGILLAFAGSVWAFATHHDGGVYFDTVATFIALMLTGRWLQERVLERNRLLLLASDGAEGLLARRVGAQGVDLVSCRELKAGDVLLVAPGDLIPVAATLTDADASCSLDWINGESTPRVFTRGESVPAGAFNAGARAVTVRATAPFSQSPLLSLLRTPVAAADAPRATVWWQRLTRTYVIAVLTTAVCAFIAWALATRDVPRAMEVATAVLVVTCPCAFGLATPLAYELTQAGLRRLGLFIRAPGLLDRLPAVRRVVFDKTGTLTTGVPEVVTPEALSALGSADREALYNIAVRSNHPRSVAIRRALEGGSPRYVPDLSVREVPGQGLELSHAGRVWRLGRPGWAMKDPQRDIPGTVFSVDGQVLAAIETAEALRPDARDDVHRLTRAGYEVWILSGDGKDRVDAMARTLGIPAGRALGGLTPEDKAAWLATHDHRDTLMIGDGINDGLAVSQAFCSGTPAIDRPFMPARTDFYFVTAGLAPVRMALRAARGLVAVNRRNLAVAVGYNLGTVSLALAGRMSPLLCAVVMPLSSLAILLATAASLRPGSPMWKS